MMATAPETGSKLKIWCTPAIATSTALSLPDHTTSHGELSDTESGSASSRVPKAAPSSSTLAGPVSSSRWIPLPARVLTVPSASDSPRSRWFTESAMTTS
jgi:hypothetical protein